jgi:hypothetical protein
LIVWGILNTLELSFEQPNWDDILDDLYAAGDKKSNPYKVDIYKLNINYETKIVKNVCC